MLGRGSPRWRDERFDATSGRFFLIGLVGSGRPGDALRKVLSDARPVNSHPWCREPPPGCRRSTPRPATTNYEHTVATVRGCGTTWVSAGIPAQAAGSGRFGRKASEVAFDLEINAQTIYSWLWQNRVTGPGTGADDARARDGRRAPASPSSDSTSASPRTIAAPTSVARLTTSALPSAGRRPAPPRTRLGRLAVAQGEAQLPHVARDAARVGRVLAR